MEERRLIAPMSALFVKTTYSFLLPLRSADSVAGSNPFVPTDPGHHDCGPQTHKAFMQSDLRQ